MPFAPLPDRPRTSSARLFRVRRLFRARRLSRDLLGPLGSIFVLLSSATLVVGTALGSAAPSLAAQPTASSGLEASSAAQPLESSWLDTEGRPLPFTEAEELLVFLRTAEMVAKRELDSGTTKPWKVTLERDGVRAHAIFRHVDVRRDRRSVREFRDSYLFEVAAYETDRLLQLGHVPPAVLRTLDGVEGSLQIWVENARSETERIESGEAVDRLALVTLQKIRMRIFDALISNFDRNTGNMLIDGTGKLWFVDHTRSFRRLDRLVESPLRCERRLWERLRALDRDQLKRHLSPYLDATQIDAMEKRRAKILDRLRDRIEMRGEQAVLFELDSLPLGEAF